MKPFLHSLFLFVNITQIFLTVVWVRRQRTMHVSQMNNGFLNVNRIRPWILGSSCREFNHSTHALWSVRPTLTCLDRRCSSILVSRFMLHLRERSTPYVLGPPHSEAERRSLLSRPSVTGNLGELLVTDENSTILWTSCSGQLCRKKLSCELEWTHAVQTSLCGKPFVLWSLDVKLQLKPER